MSFQRTLRVPEKASGAGWPLPPGLGAFPLFRVEDHRERVPPSWRSRGGVFLPVYQREALWIGFGCAGARPCAIQIGVGRINAVSGLPWEDKLTARPQNYVVCPEQPWLDGIHTGEGTVRQFVAMPLGWGYSVEAQLTGAEEFGGLQIAVYEARPGISCLPRPRRPVVALPGRMEMGIAAGSEIRQKIYPDPYGLHAWNTERKACVFVHLLNSLQFRQVTGLKLPPTPISAKTYTEHGFPWFELYDESRRDIAPSETLAGVKSVGEIDRERGLADSEEAGEPLKVKESQIRRLRGPRQTRRR